MTDTFANHPPRSFKIEPSSAGYEITLDGKPIGESIGAVDVQMRAGQVPIITLTTTAPVILDIEAQVVVQQLDVQELGGFLAAIDADELEAATLAREDLGDGSLTAAMLRQLTEWANGS